VKQDIFDQLLEFRIRETRRLLSVKAEEYTKSESDRLHNFKEAADMEGSNPADALRGMLVKHWVSIHHLVNEWRRGWLDWTKEEVTSGVNEKIGDAITYLILLEAILKESL
jgi:hypothetical protein